MVRREMRTDRLPEAGIGTLDEGLAIDRMHQRAAHAHVVERFPGVVHAGDDLAFRVAGDCGEARILLEIREKLRRADVRKGIDVAGAQRRHLRLRIVDEAEGDAVELHLARLPVIRIAHELDPVAAVPALELERPGADGIGLVGVGRLRRDDHRIAPAEEVEEVAGRLLQLDHRGRGIGRLDRRDRRENLLLRIGRGRRAGPVEGEFYVGGIEGGAVVEFRARLEMERVRQAVRRNLPDFASSGCTLPSRSIRTSPS